MAKARLKVTAGVVELVLPTSRKTLEAISVLSSRYSLASCLAWHSFRRPSSRARCTLFANVRTCRRAFASLAALREESVGVALRFDKTSLENRSSAAVLSSMSLIAVFTSCIENKSFTRGTISSSRLGCSLLASIIATRFSVGAYYHSFSVYSCASLLVLDEYDGRRALAALTFCAGVRPDTFRAIFSTVS